MTTPLGLPAWARSADHTYYGGHLQKANYLNQGVIDPLTDVSAEAICRAAEDLAAIARTTPFCVLSYTGSDTVPAAPTISAAYLMTGIQTVSYLGSSPPSGFPSASRVGDGQCSFVFASTYADAYGVVGTFTPRFVLANLSGSTGTVEWSISGQTVTVRARTTAGVDIVNARLSLMVA